MGCSQVVLCSKFSGEEQEVHFDPSKQDGSDDTGQSCDVTSSHSSRKLKNEFTSSVRQKCITSSHIDPKAYLSTEKVGGALGVASQQLLNVHEAFAGDDVVADFSREKAAAEEREREEPSVCLPGEPHSLNPHAQWNLHPSPVPPPPTPSPFIPYIVGMHKCIPLLTHSVAIY